MSAAQQNLLNNILTAIRGEVAQVGDLRATAVEMQSSDQDQYGFVLVEVHTTGADGVEQQLSLTHPGVFEGLRDRTWEDLDLLDWDGVVGEDEYGHARLSIPPQGGAPTGI